MQRAFRRFPRRVVRLPDPNLLLEGGLNVDIRHLTGGVWLLLSFLVVKVAAKFVGVLPAALRYLKPHALFTTLLMSAGLTFGTISALYGLNAGIIDQRQFTILIGAVIGAAVIPTIIANDGLRHPCTS